MLGPTADLGTTLGLVAAAAALIVRLRRARGEERQQLRWIVVAATALAVALAVMVGVGVARGAVAPWYFQAAFYLGYLAVPVATGFAVLRYRLYDVDLVIGSAVRLAALAAFVIVGYVAVVVALGRALGGTGAGCGRRSPRTSSWRWRSSRFAGGSTPWPTGSCTAAAPPPTRASRRSRAASGPNRICSNASREPART